MTIFLFFLLNLFLNISIIASAIFCVFIIIAILYMFILPILDEDDFKRLNERLSKHNKKAKIVLTISFLLCIVSVSEQRLAFYAAAYTISKVENIEKLPDNVVSTLNKYMENYLEKDE